MGELWRLADEPYLCFDGDNAGRRAAARAAERALPLLRAGKSLRFLALPAGEDPDSLIRTRGADAIRRSLDLARSLSDVVWTLETEGKPADTPERRASLQRAVEQRVAEIADPVVRDYYRSDMRSRLGRFRRPEGDRGSPAGGGPFRGPGPEPAPFAAGSAAQRSGTDLDGSRQERALLGAPDRAACPPPRPGRGPGRPADRPSRACPPAQRPARRAVDGSIGDRPGSR